MDPDKGSYIYIDWSTSSEVTVVAGRSLCDDLLQKTRR